MPATNSFAPEVYQWSVSAITDFLPIPAMLDLAHFYRLLRILAMERFFCGESYEWPYHFLSDDFPIPADDLSDLLPKKSGTIFASAHKTFDLRELQDRELNPDPDKYIPGEVLNFRKKSENIIAEARGITAKIKWFEVTEPRLRKNRELEREEAQLKLRFEWQDAQGFTWYWEGRPGRLVMEFRAGVLWQADLKDYYWHITQRRPELFSDVRRFPDHYSAMQACQEICNGWLQQKAWTTAERILE